MKSNVFLLVEDNPDDAELLLRSLKRYHVSNEIVVMHDGVEALDYLFATGVYAGRNTNTMPAVVLLDLKLPKMDGLQVLQRMRADDRTKFLPVIIITSSKEEQDLINTYELGANSYVCKPVDFVQFSNAARKLGLCWLLLSKPSSEEQDEK